METRAALNLDANTKGNLTSKQVIQQEILFNRGEYYDTLPEPSITAEEAMATADAFLASIGLENTECSYWEENKLVYLGETLSEGWYLEYAPVLKGTRGVNLVSYQKSPMLSPELASQYSRPLKAEYITLYVTEKGVERFDWDTPYELVEIANEDVSILPFEEIQESVRKYFTLAFSWIENPESFDANKFTVKRIVLTSYFVQVKDDPDGAYRVPVWAVFYISDGEEAAYCLDSVMLINALDGTMIYK